MTDEPKTTIKSFRMDTTLLRRAEIALKKSNDPRLQTFTDLCKFGIAHAVEHVINYEGSDEDIQDLAIFNLHREYKYQMAKLEMFREIDVGRLPEGPQRDRIVQMYDAAGKVIEGRLLAVLSVPDGVPAEWLVEMEGEE